MIWNVLNNIAGAIAIAGAVAVAIWYFDEVVKKIKEL